MCVWHVVRLQGLLMCVQLYLLSVPPLKPLGIFLGVISYYAMFRPNLSFCFGTNTSPLSSGHFLSVSSTSFPKVGELRVCALHLPEKSLCVFSLLLKYSVIWLLEGRQQMVEAFLGQVYRATCL